MKTMMKKSMAALFALSVSVSGASAYAAADVPPRPVGMKITPEAAEQQQVRIYVDNEPLGSDGYRQPAGQTLMVPLRAVAEKLGFTVEWEESERMAELAKGEWRINVKLGEDRYATDDGEKSLGTAPELTDSKTYVPVSFVGEVLYAQFAVEGSTIFMSPLQQRENVLTRGVVTEVYGADDGAFVRINGIGTDGIVLSVDKDTTYQMEDGTELKLSDLAAGMAVEAEHSAIATMSLPPRTATYRITVLEQAKLKDVFGTAGRIEEVRTADDGTVSLRISGKGLSDRAPDEVVLRVPDTAALVTPEGEPVELGELTEGAKVIGFYGAALSKSLPPIGTAWKIVLQAPADRSAE